MQISFSKLNNNQLYTLGLRTNEVIEPRPIDEMGLRLYYDTFKEAYDKFVKGIQHEKISAEIIPKKDKLRDRMYLGFVGNLNNYLYYPDDKIVKEIKELLAIIAKFGPRVVRKTYAEETAIILKVINLVENYYLELMTKTQSNVWFNLLKEKQADFENTERQYAKALSEDNIESATSVRPELVDAMREMFTFMPLHYKVTRNKDLGKLIALLEKELSRF